MKKSDHKGKVGKVSKRQKFAAKLEMLNPNVAGVDIANNVHYAAVSSHLTDECIRSFGTFTADLHQMADWFRELGIESVAMESTGVYWQTLFEILEQRGFKVILVNARYPKNVGARKSDVADSSWIQQLHSYGLLPASFIPDEYTKELRVYVRQRQQLIKEKAQHLQRIGKALQLMNVKLQNVISDIGGKFGQKVIRAIVAGQHTATDLAKFHNKTLKVSKEELIKALQGNFKKEHPSAECV